MKGLFMPLSASPPRTLENLILGSLPRERYEIVFPHLEQVHLVRGQILHEIGLDIVYAYLPMQGMISLLSATEDGGTIEVGFTGNDGMVGLSPMFGVKTSPYRAMVQIPSIALKIKAHVIKSEFERCGHFQDVLLRYAHASLTQVSQFAVCHHFHKVEKRLCLWLLITRDLIQADTFEFTQEFLANMLGVPRTSVTMIASTLQKAGLIHYRRGKIQLLNPSGLESTACECYRIIRDERENIFSM
jgi:CRP-like cAMP-binding protein